MTFAWLLAERRCAGQPRRLTRFHRLPLSRAGPAAEEQEADQLRLAVAEALCRTHKRRSEFGNAVIAVEAQYGNVGQ